jgi:predicted dithiol-disulfide oxidoreductase (DUF899 family)
MYGPDYTVGACPGCTNLADGFDATSPQQARRDHGLLLAGADRLAHRLQRAHGWEFPYVSTYDTDFPWDFGLALTEEQAQQIPEVKQMVDNPPEWLRFWASQIGAELKDGIRENPSYIAFAMETGPSTTPIRCRPDPFVAPYLNLLLDRTPKEQQDEPLNYRKDEYPD